jgi:hypothetical protein
MCINRHGNDNEKPHPGLLRVPCVPCQRRRRRAARFRRRAANARQAYFEKIAPHGIYIGTDKTELWNREQFKAWSKRFFDRKSAWTFKATKRNVYVSADRKFIWFDELLDTQMGVCQASGVMRKTDKGFEIEHYQLSLAVPNEVADQVTKVIKEFEARTVAK